MKAVSLKGNADHQVVRITIPSVGPEEILVEVHYAAIDTAYESIVKKDMVSGYIRDMKHSPIVPAYHVCGSVVSIGSRVTTRSVGEIVFGFLEYFPKQQQGSLSEFVTLSERACSVKPASLSKELAVSCSVEGSTALQAIRNLGTLKKGDSILIVGAGGGVGSLATAIALSMGALVTVVCSTKDVNRMESMGVSKILNRSKFRGSLYSELDDGAFDVILDASNKYSFFRMMMKLKPEGKFVNALPTVEVLLLGWLWPMITTKKLLTVEVRGNEKDLATVAQILLNTDKPSDVVPIDSVHKVSEMNQAWARYNSSDRGGRVVIQVKDEW